MRCYVHPQNWTAGDLLLDEEESHHVLRVMRLQPGQTLEIFDGRGRRGAAELTDTRGARARLRLISEQAIAPNGPRIVLQQALPREQKMDWILQKATELGIQAIQPILAERCVVQLRGDRAADKQARWEKIVLNAAKQSGSLLLPEILPPASMAQVLKTGPRCDLLLIGALTGPTKPLREILRASGEKPPASIGILIGPEGDFTPAEQELALQAGAVPVSFGDSVLRAETAALFALSALRYVFAHS